MSINDENRTLILGAGYCGLAAALELGRQGASYVIVEKSGSVGGLSKTIELDGSEFELGPHIYFDRDPEVSSFWRDLIGDEMETHYRRNRLFYNDTFIKSPLDPIDALLKLGPLAIIRIFSSFFVSKIKRIKINNAEDWVIANFGKELYLRFFKIYNEKIWGLNCNSISANWAGQRIKSSLYSFIVNSLTRKKSFIVKTFNFPRRGSKSVYDAMEGAILSYGKGELRLDCRPISIGRRDDQYEVEFTDERKEYFTHIISTIHLDELYALLKNERSSDDAESSINSLVFRNLIVVNLRFKADTFRNMKEHWIDIHDPNVSALRVTNYRNYKKDIVEDDEAITAVGVEYNCFPTEKIWTFDDRKILEIAIADLKKMRLADGEPISYSVYRVEKAYPVYYNGYEKNLIKIRKYFSKYENLILSGRNSLYKWNNMHHSVKTGILAARNVLGEKHDLTVVKGNVTFGKESD